MLSFFLRTNETWTHYQQGLGKYRDRCVEADDAIQY